MSDRITGIFDYTNSLIRTMAATNPIEADSVMAQQLAKKGCYDARMCMYQVPTEEAAKRQAHFYSQLITQACHDAGLHMVARGVITKAPTFNVVLGIGSASPGEQPVPQHQLQRALVTLKDEIFGVKDHKIGSWRLTMARLRGELKAAYAWNPNISERARELKPLAEALIDAAGCTYHKHEQEFFVPKDEMDRLLAREEARAQALG